MRKIVLVIGVIIAVAIGVSLSTLRTRVDRGARTFAEELAAATGFDVTIGDLSFAVFPPAVTVNDIVVSDRVTGDEHFSIVEFPRVLVEPRILPLLMGRATIDVIDVYDPILRIRRDPNRVIGFLSNDMLNTVVASPVDVRIHDGVVEVIDEIHDAGFRLRATGVEAEIGFDGETIVVEAEGAPLGESSRGRIDLRLSPGAGPTGGHAMQIDASVSAVEIDAAKSLFPILADVDLHGPIEIALEGGGFLGERATESVPAEGWEGRLVVNAGVGVAGQVRESSFSVAAAIDDKRYLARSGRGNWGDMQFDVSGWSSRTGNGKLSGRLVFDELAAEDVAATFGAPEAWRPKGDVALTMRVMGSAREPLFRYEARAQEISLTPWPNVSFSASPLQARGSMLAVNAEINGSLDCENLKIGEFGLDQALVGIAYWREKLTVTSTNNDVWRGTLGGGIAYWPHADDMIEGGGMLSNASAADALSVLFPGIKDQLTGYLDGMIQVQQDVRGSGILGRFTIHDGSFGDRNYVADILRSAFEGNAGVVDSLVADYPATLGKPTVKFRKISFDAQTRDEGYSLHAVHADLYDTTWVMDGLVQAGGDEMSTWGTLVLSEGMSGDLIGRVRGIESLIAADGKLRIPFKARNEDGTFTARADSEFDAALAGSARGVAVSPFESIESDTSAFSELPDMVEQFGR